MSFLRAALAGNGTERRLLGIWFAMAAAVADARVAEAWVGLELQRTWPLHATVGVETWRAPGHPTLPLEGTRLRLGVAHRMGMTAGSPTFDAP